MLRTITFNYRMEKDNGVFYPVIFSVDIREGSSAYTMINRNVPIDEFTCMYYGEDADSVEFELQSGEPLATIKYKLLQLAEDKITFKSIEDSLVFIYLFGKLPDNYEVRSDI